jgi:hypothetical protein
MPWSVQAGQLLSSPGPDYLSGEEGINGDSRCQLKSVLQIGCKKMQLKKNSTTTTSYASSVKSVGYGIFRCYEFI